MVLRGGPLGAPKLPDFAGTARVLDRGSTARAPLL
jgi:hypothetical protein